MAAAKALVTIGKLRLHYECLARCLLARDLPLPCRSLLLLLPVHSHEAHAVALHTYPPGHQGQPDARVEHLQEHPLHGQLHAVVVPSLPGLVPLSIRILEGTHLFLVLPRHRSLTDLSAEAADVLPA